MPMFNKAMLLAGLLVSSLISGAVLAQESRQARLGGLFDPEISTMMSRAIERIRWQELDAALEILNEIVTRAPDYAEAWNQRATVYFLLGQYEKSLSDVAETLEREPRHFGALAGRGIIRMRQGKPALGYQSILAAMEFNPYLRERELVPEEFRPAPD